MEQREGYKTVKTGSRQRMNGRTRRSARLPGDVRAGPKSPRSRSWLFMSRCYCGAFQGDGPESGDRDASAVVLSLTLDLSLQQQQTSVALPSSSVSHVCEHTLETCSSSHKVMVAS